MWKKIRYFTPDEEWGNAGKVNPYLIIALDELRHKVGSPIIVHCAYSTSGHSKNSMHYEGKAVDFHIKGMSLVDQYLAAEKIGLFNGIGVYPFWNNPGLHIDIRTKPARWGRNAAGVLCALNAKFINTCLNV